MENLRRFRFHTTPPQKKNKQKENVAIRELNYIFWVV